MRVQLLTPRQPHDDRGAVAVMVALLSTLLLVLAAFAVDIGNAYAVARQQSVAADAAVLAAAAKVGEAIPRGQACTQALLNSISANTLAKTTADAYNTANNKSGVSEPVVSATVTCATADAVEVRVDNSRAVPTSLAGIIGITEINPGSYAVARYQRTLSAGGLRPWAICDSVVRAASLALTTTFATGIDTQSGPCNSVASGNWGGVDFNGGSNPAGDLAAWTLLGYPNPVTIPNPLLPADPGVSGSSGLDIAFTNLVGKVVLFPSVTGFNPGSGSGSNASFNAVGLATVRICGVKYANTTYNIDPATGLQSDCWVNPVGTTTVVVSPPVTTTGTMAVNSNVLTIASGLFPTVANPNVVITVTVQRAGNPPGSLPLGPTVATPTSATTATLAAPAKRAVAGVAVTITTTTTTYSGLVPRQPNGDPIDHIQFRWVNYSVSNYPGSNSTPCAFTDQQCVGFTSLWK